MVSLQRAGTTSAFPLKGDRQGLRQQACVSVCIFCAVQIEKGAAVNDAQERKQCSNEI